MKHIRQLVALVAIQVASGLGGASALGTSTQEMLQKAPVFQLLLDNSGSSPATDANFVASAWPLVEGRLRAMPIGTVVIVNSVGDAALAPMTMRTRIQKVANGEGAPLDDIVRRLKSIVLGFPARVQSAAHGQSHLVGGLFDASKNTNRDASSQNVIVVLSDLLEFSPVANCYRAKACPLPRPTFKLDNTEILALGVGRGLPSDHEIAVFVAWEKFFDQAGARYSLKKTF
jgi:hypothetical protein